MAYDTYSRIIIDTHKNRVSEIEKILPYSFQRCGGFFIPNFERCEIAYEFSPPLDKKGVADLALRLVELGGISDFKFTGSALELEKIVEEDKKREKNTA